MWSGKLPAYGLALFGIGLAGHRRTEEKDPEDSEKDEEFEDDKPDERTAPSLVFEAFQIEIPYFAEQPCHPIPFCKYNNNTCKRMHLSQLFYCFIILLSG